MTPENPQENWQVEVNGQIYAAVMAELPSWIEEGSLQPGDKIRRGNLRWIEAGKVPALVPFFNAKQKGEILPVIKTFSQPELASAAPSRPVENETPAPPASFATLPPPRTENKATTSQKSAPGICSVHTDMQSFYVCGTCENEFCKPCPKSFGGSVRICPNCDALCKPIDEAASVRKRSAAAAGHTAAGFGIHDFFHALSYPFRFKPSLIFGGLMFMFFTLGQSASAIGGIFMAGASIVCVLLANMLTFGVLANTVENFTQGKLDADFMPSFDDFSLWDDVVHPFILSIGVYISSFGAFFLVVVIGVYLVFSTQSAQMKTFENEISRVPGTEYYQPDRTMEQSQEVRELLEKVKQQNAQRIEQQTRAAESSSAPANERNSAEFQELIEKSRAAQIEAVQEKASAAQQEQSGKLLSSILRLAAPLVVVGFITFVWGLFYFPAACAVAGYSRSFLATINPMVGLDTIRRLGLSYVKILLMGLCILLASGVITGLLALLFSPLNLPKIGNLPAAAIGSLFTFYFSIVFSCVLGLALYKAGDRLKLYK